MAGVVLTKKPSLGKRFFIISILALILCSLIIVSTMYAPFWPFFPVQRIDALPKQEDLLVFTASMFTTRDTRDYSSLFVLSPEKETLYKWVGGDINLLFKDTHQETGETKVIPTYITHTDFLDDCESYLRSYAWLHQGSRLSVLCVGETVKLWIIDTDTKQTNIRKLEELDLKIGFGPHNMAWSPDDTKLAFSAVGNDAHYWGSADGGTLICSEDIYIFDTEKNTLTKIPLTHWLSVIQNMVWVKISQ